MWESQTCSEEKPAVTYLIQALQVQGRCWHLSVTHQQLTSCLVEVSQALLKRKGANRTLRHFVLYAVIRRTFFESTLTGDVFIITFPITETIHVNYKLWHLRVRTVIVQKKFTWKQIVRVSVQQLSKKCSLVFNPLNISNVVTATRGLSTNLNKPVWEEKKGILLVSASVISDH